MVNNMKKFLVSFIPYAVIGVISVVIGIRLENDISDTEYAEVANIIGRVYSTIYAIFLLLFMRFFTSDLEKRDENQIN